MIESSPNIVISTDLEGKILIFNRTAEGAFGYRKRDVLKKKVDRLFKEPMFFSGKKGRAFRPEVVCIKKDGSQFPASMLASEVEDAAGRKIAKMMLLSDLTEQKAMEERLF